MSAIQESIQEVYIGLLGRAADLEGLTYWEGQINSGFTIEDLRENIINSQTEYAEGLGLLSRGELVEALYDNMFGRTPDLEGYAYWTAGEGAAVADDDMVTTLVNAAQGSDVTILDNKATAANYFTNNAPDSTDTAAAASAVANVDETEASVTAAQTQVDQIGNTAPTITVDASATVNENDTVTITTTSTDADEGDTLTLSATATNGTVALAADGTATFTPTADYFGDAVVTFTVTDSAGETATGSTAVTVDRVADVQALTDSDDTFVGTALEDVFTAAVDTLSADDSITDSTTGDGDSLTVTDNDQVAMDVSGVETIAIDWTGFGTPSYDLDNVSGATITLTSSSTGYQGNATFTNVEANNINASTGIDGTLTVEGYDGANVTASVADEISMGGTTEGDGVITVTANLAETVSIDGAETIVLSALVADTVTLTGTNNLYDTATVTLGVDATVTATGKDDSTLILNSDADIAVDLAAATELEVLTLGGDGTITVDVQADLDQFTNDLVVNNGGDIEFSGVITAQDFSNVSATSITLSDTTGGVTLNFADDAVVVLESSLLGALTFAPTASNDATSDTLNLTLEAVQGQDLIFNGTSGSNDYENVNLTIAPPSTFDTDGNFTIHELRGDNTASNGSNTDFVITSTNADVNIVIDDIDAANVNATAVAGNLNMTAAGDAATEITIQAAAGETTVDFVQAAANSNFISGNSSDDNISFATTSGDAYALFSGGDNVVEVDSDVSGSLTVIGGTGEETISTSGAHTGEIAAILGAGDDTFSATDADSASYVINGGAGDDGIELLNLTKATVAVEFLSGTNTVHLDGAFNGITATVTGGSGNDALTVEDAMTANDTLTFNGGDGTDTLILEEDFRAGTITLSNVAIIDVNTNHTAVLVDEELLDGQTFEIRGADDITDLLRVDIDETTDSSYDFSNISVNVSAGQQIGGLRVTTNTGDDTVVLTGGNDKVIGSAGSDTFTGGLGSDTFVYDGSADISAVEEAGDTVTDHSVNDTIGLLLGETAIGFDDKLKGSSVFVLDTDAISAGEGVTTAAMLAVASTATVQFSSLITAGFATGGNAYFENTAALSAAIADFQAYLTGLAVSAGVDALLSADGAIVIAKLYDGTDYHMAFAFIADDNCAIAGSQVDIHVINMNDSDFDVTAIDFLASA